MQASGKTFGREPSEMPPNVGLREKEQQESWENLFRQARGKESYFSFTRTVENPIQWIHLLDPFDQQNLCNGSKGLNVDCGHEKSTGSETFHGATSCFKDHSNSSMKGNGVFGRGPQESEEEMPSLRLPEAMVALAQAAAKGNGLSGWPFMSPFRVQMQKCEKCSIEFYSPLNYRRHIRMMHRRPLNSEKDDFSKERMQLATFWDKLTPEAASSIIASKSLILEDLTGESVVRALATLLQQPGLSSLPRSFIKAGASLLKVVQNKPSQLTSQELLNVLDESSEKTFLSLVSSSNDRYSFEGGARKIGLESKNLVASLAYLVERNLVKAWMDDKDAEAWRCQRALVEEEEASQKMLAEIQERKRLKKVRQKELKERKSVDPTLGPQSLDIDPMDGENLQGTQEGDDSPCALQSSHSSSMLSGQCVNADSFKTDVNELESYTGRFDNLYFRLAGEGSEIENQQEITSDGSSEFLKEKEVNKEMLQMVVTTGSSQRLEPEEAVKKLAETVCSQEASDTNRTDFQNGSLKDVWKPSTDSKMLACGRIVPAQKFKESWEDGNHFDSNNLKNYPKPSSLAGSVLNDLNKEDKHRASRKPSGLAGHSLQEVPWTRANQKMSAYSYHEKLPGYRSYTRFQRAVWTKKVHQTSNVGINKLSEYVESTDAALDLTQALPFQSPLPESIKQEGASMSAQADTSDASSCGSAQDSSDFENCSFKVSIPFDARCGFLPASNGQVHLSGPGSCQLFEPSDKVEANGHYDKDSSLTDVSSLEDLEDQLLLHDVVQKVEGSNGQSFCNCQSTIGVADHSLVIGSLSVPLGKSSADLCDTVHSPSSHEKVTQMSQGINQVHGRKDRNEAVYEGENKGSGRLHQESLGALQENGVPSLGFRKEALKLRTRLDPECKENHEQIYTEAVGLERLTKRAPWSSENPKFGRTKVWRPVGVGQSSAEIACNESKFGGVPHKNGLGDSPSLGKDGHEYDTVNILDNENVNRDSIGSNMEIFEMKTESEMKQGWHKGASHEASYEDEGTSLKHSAVNTETDIDNVESIASKEEFGNLAGNELNHRLRFLSSEHLASFLSQRWINAVTAQESLMPSMYKEKGQNPGIMKDMHGAISTIDSKADQSLGLPPFSDQYHGGNVDVVSGNDRKSSLAESSKEGELSTLAVAANSKFRAKDRWHHNAKVGRSEFKYIPK